MACAYCPNSVLPVVIVGDVVAVRVEFAPDAFRARRCVSERAC
jgi:hypothetical protein